MSGRVVCMLYMLAFLTGCVPSHSFEIQSQSLRHVRRADIEPVIGTDTDLPLVTDWSIGDFVVLTFEANENLVELARRMGSSLFVDMHFCEQPEEDVLLGIPDVYLNGRSVGDLKHYTSDATKNERDGQHSLTQYEVVIFVAWTKERKLPESLKKGKAQQFFLKYDLTQNPQDICLSLRGSNLVQTIRSNQITVTAKQVRNVLDKQ